MPEWMVGLNCAVFTLPILIGCICIIAAMAFKDWKEGR